MPLEEIQINGTPLAPSELPVTRNSAVLNAKHIHVLTPEAGVILVVFDHAEGGFTFYRHVGAADAATKAFKAFLTDPVVTRYMPATYELREADADGSVLAGIIGNYRRLYGDRLAAKIDALYFVLGGKKFYTVLIPKEIIQAMLADKQGELITHVSGSAAALRSVPILAGLVGDDVEGASTVRRGFVTTYTAGGQQASRAIHWKVVRQVLAVPNSGISVGPVAVWTP